MMVDRKKLIELIPWYLNGTLTGTELDEVTDFCTNDPDGRAALVEWKKLHLLIHISEAKQPSVEIETRLFDRIRSRTSEQFGIFHPYALGLSLVILALLWMIIRPGVTLNWRITSTQATTFRIYRSEVDGTNYRLLDEIPVDASEVDYEYIDLFFWPLKDYIYYVEGMNQTISMGFSQIVASPALIALPGQIAMICASFIIGYGIILLIRYRKLLLIGNIRLVAV
jgi:hypothetical protein